MSTPNSAAVEQAKQDMISVGKSIFERGLTCGSSANISIRVEGGFVVTPTNSCIGFLDPDTMTVLDTDGNHIAGDKASKEFILHHAFYLKRPTATAVIHLHSTYATAVSCLANLNIDNAVTPYTPYLIMRLGQIGVVPYFPPGDSLLGEAVGQKAVDHAGILMANHGPIVAGDNIWSTMYAIEELEECCKLMLLLSAHDSVQLDSAQIDTLITRFKK